MDATLRVITPQPEGAAQHGVHHPRDPLSAVIIGMGPAGLGAALSLTALGFRVHVVERDTLLDAGGGGAPTPSQVRAVSSRCSAALPPVLALMSAERRRPRRSVLCTYDFVDH